ILREVKPDQLGRLLARHSTDLNTEVRAEIVRLLTSPDYEVQEYPENPDGKGLETTGSNYYEKGITAEEVRRVLDKSLKPTLNNRVFRTDKGLACELYTTQSPGLVGERLKRVVAALEAARAHALTAH